MRRSHSVFGYYYYTDWEHSDCGPREGREATYKYARDVGFEPNHLALMPVDSAYLGFWNMFQVLLFTVLSPIICIYVRYSW